MAAPGQRTSGLPGSSGAYDHALAPPAVSVNKSMKSKLDKLAADKALLAKHQVLADKTIFLDYSSPGVRKRREDVRANFEYYCQMTIGTEDNTLSTAQIWNSQTITERTKLFMHGMVEVAKGRVGEKPRADLLWHIKNAIYWWAVRFIPDFTQVFAKWHTLSVQHIHGIAIESNLEKSRYKKRNLTDMELLLFFQKIMRLDTGIENWLQQYAAWLLVYMCAVRPGSFTVCPGYEAGNRVGSTTTVVRDVDETLRWKDVEFVRFKTGLGMRITFRFSKGYRDPYRGTMVEGTRCFTFPPSNGDQSELDVGLVFLSLAFTRQLFGDRKVDNIFHGDEMFLAKDAAVNELPVFLKSDQAGSLRKQEAMREGVLNVKLQEMCNMVGLLERFTMYALRRTALVETRRTEGTETARELATHVPGGLSIHAYDNEGLADMDLTNLRLKQSGGLQRDEIRRMFGPSSIARYDPDVGNFTHILKEKVNTRLFLEQRFIDMESNVLLILTEIATFLKVEDVGYNPAIVEKYLKTLSNIDNLSEGCSIEEATRLSERLQQVFGERKQLRKKLRRELANRVKEEMITENKAALTQSKKNANTSRGGKDGRQPELLRQAQEQAPADLESLNQQTASALAAMDADAAASGDDDDDDTATVEELQDQGREEPAAWANLPDEEVAIQTGNGSEVNHATRRAFFAKFVAKSQETIQHAALDCFLCKLDPTATVTDKKKKYSLTRLDRHVKQAHSSQGKRLGRAFAATVGADSPYCCPLCAPGQSDASFTTFGSFWDHLEEEHPSSIT